MKEKLTIVREYEKKRKTITDYRKRPMYHLTGVAGWINDPNGFSVFQNKVHLFFQENPYSSSVGPIYWGHVKTEDFVRWERLPVALAPDEEYDKDGCFSGGACELPDGRHMILYTGHSTVPDSLGGCVETQCAAFGDGIDYQKSVCNPVIGSEMIPEGGSTSDFRDPKLTFETDRLRALVVNKDTSDSGAVLMYESSDGLNWTYRGTLIRNDNRFGKMWECPDLFRLGKKDVLIASVQEMQKDVPGFREGFETLGIIGTYDNEAVHFYEESITTLDHGPDFYAPTTVLLKDGRRVMTAWMQNWETAEDRPEGLDFCGQMILPRELSVEHGRLYKRPVREIEAYRGKAIIWEKLESCEETRLDGLSGRCLDLKVNLKKRDWCPETAEYRICLAADEQYRTVTKVDFGTEMITVDLKNSGNPKSMAKQFSLPASFHEGQLKLRFLLDRYSMELFVNDGEQTASFLIYTPQRADRITVEGDKGVVADIVGYSLEFPKL